MFTRREFLKTSSMIALGSSALGASVPAFLGRTAAQAPASQQPGSRDTILVVVQLTGGNDGLNTVVPFGAREYYDARPRLAIPEAEVLKVDPQRGLGLHPQ